MRDRYLWIILVSVVAVLAIFFGLTLFFRQQIPKVEEPKVVVKTPTVQVTPTPAANPFGVKTNPFKNVKTNPFE